MQAICMCVLIRSHSLTRLQDAYQWIPVVIGLYEGDRDGLKPISSRSLLRYPRPCFLNARGALGVGVEAVR
jgi:hypothetical protein